MRIRFHFLKRLSTIVALSSLPLAVAAQYVPVETEPDKRPLLQQVQGDTKVGLYLCGMTFRLAQLGGPPDKSDYGACIKQWREKGMQTYDKAVRTVRKPAAQAALKDYMAAWSAALSGIVPVGNESRITYDARQAQASTRLDELWARFELENR